MAIIRLVWIALLLALPVATEAAPVRIILLDPQYDASSVDGQTAEMTAADLPRVKDLGERLKAAIKRSPDYELIDNPTVSAELSNYNLGACGRCELMLGKKAGADAVAILSLQKISSQLSNMTVFFYKVADGEPIATGAIVLHSNSDEDWKHGIKSIATNKLKLPKEPKN